VKNAVEMGSGVLIYIYIYMPSFIKVGSGIQSQTRTVHGDPISILLFVQNKGSRLKCSVYEILHLWSSIM
jgi:hypothetical protein